ncbi:MAG: hypothetical protein RR346_05535 [Bacteroidales bacterium]
MSTVEKAAEWKINGHLIDVFEIESNYIARIYAAGDFKGIRVYKKNFLNRLRSVRRSLEKELSADFNY